MGENTFIFTLFIWFITDKSSAVLYKGGRIHTLTPFSQHPHTDTFGVHTSPPSNITLHLIKLFILTYLPRYEPASISAWKQEPTVG